MRASEALFRILYKININLRNFYMVSRRNIEELCDELAVTGSFSDYHDNNVIELSIRIPTIYGSIVNLSPAEYFYAALLGIRAYKKQMIENQFKHISDNSNTSNETSRLINLLGQHKQKAKGSS